MQYSFWDIVCFFQILRHFQDWENEFVIFQISQDLWEPHIKHFQEY